MARWTQEDDRAILTLYRQGLSPKRIKAILRRMNKTADAIEGRIRTLRRTDDDRRARAAQDRERYAKSKERRETEDLARFPRLQGRTAGRIASFQVPTAVLAERDHAFSSPRTLDAELNGDPRPGRSALDRARTPRAPLDGAPKPPPPAAIEVPGPSPRPFISLNERMLARKFCEIFSTLPEGVSGG